MYGANGTVSPFCGQTLQVMNPATGQTVTATVQDDCMLCTGELSLDMSESTFEAIGTLSEGVIEVEWWWVDANVQSEMPTSLGTQTIAVGATPIETRTETLPISGGNVLVEFTQRARHRLF